MAGISVAIFGGLRLWRNGHEAEIGSGRQRIVLAELICAGGDVVSISALVDALWDQDPAASAVNQVHRIVGQLRRTLEPGLSPHSAGSTILASGTGYRIAVDHLRCDLFELRELTRRAEDFALGGDRKSATPVYAEALELAQGALFGGLDSRVKSRAEFLAVERERVAIAVSAADLAIGQGSTAQILAGVTAIAAGDPLNEPLHARVIRLLDGAGRRADALATFDAIRRRLADELGVGPGRELTDAHNDLLVADRDDARAGREVPVPRPAQLPRPLSGFVHRSDAEALLGQSLSEVDGTVVISAFGGMGGIGKTALAVQWAHQVKDQFPDGQLFVNLRGFDPGGRATGAGEALNSLLEGLGESVAGMSELDVDARAARYRTLMSGRRMIVVLDNARDSEQVRPLLPGSSRSLVLVTSRNRLTGLIARENARFVPLGRLNPPQARQLLANRLGERRTIDTATVMDKIVAGCAGLPLALSIVAARIATTPELSPAQVVSRLVGPHAGLAALSTGEERDDVKSAFSWSYHLLSPGAAKLFRLLGAHPGPDISLSLLASVAAMSVPAVRMVADELVNAHLLTESAADRYVVHDLLRLYAGELLYAAGHRDRAERRVVDHYRSATRTAYLTYGRDPIADIGAVCRDLTVEPCPSMASALAWYGRERASLEAVVDLCTAKELHRAAVLLVLDRRPMNQTVDAKPDSLPQGVRVLDAAIAAQGALAVESSLIAELHRDVGHRYVVDNSPGSQDRADRHYHEASVLFEQIGDLSGQSNVSRTKSFDASVRGDDHAGLRYAREALRLARLARRPDLIAVNLMTVSGSLADVGHYEEAIAIASEALDAFRAQGMTYAEPDLGYTLATGWLALGNPVKALQIARWALDKNADAQNLALDVALLAVAAAAAGASDDADARAYIDRYRHIIGTSGSAAITALGLPATMLGRYSAMVDRAAVSVGN